MTTVTVHQAKTNLSALLRRVEAGEEIVIARGDKPVAVLKSYVNDDMAGKRRAAMGMWSGKYPCPPDHVLIGPASDEDLVEMFGHKFVDDMRPADAVDK